MKYYIEINQRNACISYAYFNKELKLEHHSSLGYTTNSYIFNLKICRYLINQVYNFTSSWKDDTKITIKPYK